jgi:hypothetical protein
VEVGGFSTSEIEHEFHAALAERVRPLAFRLVILLVMHHCGLKQPALKRVLKRRLMGSDQFQE